MATSANYPRAEVEPLSETARGERRHLTVMFCDLVASSALAERLDPEDFGNVLAEYHQTCARAIAEFDGYVAQLLGDGVLAYFSYPRAHEDDAERALRAAIRLVYALDEANPRLREEYGIDLAVRIGIHTGFVVVGEIGGRAHTENLALGHTVNVAARLQKEAKAGSILISADTLRLVRGLFVIEELGKRHLAGMTEPIAVYRVVQLSGVKSRLEAAVASGLTPLVGRETDLALLLARWVRARAAQGRAVVIRGEPGIGKSRLVYALRERIEDEHHSWLECRGSPYHENTALFPFVELLRQGLRFDNDDSAETTIDRLERGIAQAGLAPEVFPLLADLLSLRLPDRVSRPALGPEALRRKTLEALASWLFALSKLQPLVLVFEDLQWADASSLELFGMLIERVESEQVLLMATCRAGFEAPWPDRCWQESMTIDALTPRQTAEMVGQIAGSAVLSPPVVEQIVRVTDGVPLFVEELTWSALDLAANRPPDGAARLKGWAIPPTLQDSLEERLDRLGAAKEVAQLAAVLGRQFSYDLLAAVSTVDSDHLDRALGELVSAGLLYRWGTPLSETFIFKHALLQDAAYESLLKTTRRQRHARIAAVLEERFPDRVARLPEEVARHCDEAGLFEKAIAYYQRAASAAARRSANTEAIGHLSRGLVLLHRQPKSAARDERELALQISLGALFVAAKGWGSPEAEAVYGCARALCEDLGTPPTLFDAIRGLVAFYTARAEFDTVENLCDTLLRLAEIEPQPAHLLLAHHQIANLHYFRGEPISALEHYERAASLYDPGEHRGLAFHYGADLGVASRCYMPWVLWQLGYPDRAVAVSREAIAISQVTGHHFSLAYALQWAAVLHVMRRERGEARALAERALAIAEEEDFAFFRAAARLTIAWAGLEPGLDVRELDARVDAVRSAFAEVASTGQRSGAPANLGYFADSYLAVGRVDDARASIGAALAFAEQTQQPYWNAELRRIEAELLLRDGAAESGEPERLLGEALGFARRQEARSIELRVAMSLARLRLARGERSAGRDLLASAYTWFREGFDAPDLREAKVLLDALS